MGKRGTGQASDPQKVLAAGYTVSRTNGSVRFVAHASRGPGRTARFAAGIGAILGVVLTGFWAYGVHSTLQLHDPDVGPPEWVLWLFPSGPLLLLAGLSFAAAVNVWLRRNVSLLVGPSGQVRYGRRELVPAGTAKSVRVERVSRWVSPESGPDYEQKTAHVYVERTDGRFTELPYTYFSSLDGWELGEALGGALAAALRVPVSTDPPPGTASSPRRWDRRGRLVTGVFVLLIGVPHFAGGFAVVGMHLPGLVSAAHRQPDDAAPWWLGAVFVVTGAAACWFGCRAFGVGLRGYLGLLAAIAGMEVVAWVWFHWA